MDTSPPKPRAALRIGVTGHRPDKLSPEAAARIEVQLITCFAAIKAQLEVIKQQFPQVFAPNAPKLSLVTSLAEGADRVAAHAAARAGMTVDAILPFPREAYAKDFTSEGSKVEFDELLTAAVLEFDIAEEAAGAPSHATLGYEAAGLMVLRQCDLLIAIWNGEPASGRAGTAHIVEAARQSGIPCIWFDSTKPQTSIRKPSTRLIDSGIAAEWQAFTPAELERAVNALVRPPTDAQPLGLARLIKPLATGAERYLKETLPASNSMYFAYPLLVDIMLGNWRRARTPFKSYTKRHRAGVETSEGWGEEYWTKVGPALTPHAPAMRGILEQRFLWADQLAAHYALRYRSTFVMLFLLAPMIVSCAVLGLIIQETYWLAKLFSIFELGFIITMISLGLWGQHQNWHQLWIDYRHLAEMLRHARILVLTGTSLPEMHKVPEPGALDTGTQWVQWYYRAAIRELGLCGTKLNRAHAEKVAGIVRTTELKEQIAFHEANAKRQHRLEANLESAGITLLVVSALFAAAHLFLGWKGVNFFTIALPAFGAALFAIRAQGDFGGVAHRAEAMASHLKTLDREIAEQQHSGITVSLLSACADAAADTMLSEVSQWRQIFFSKRLALPA